MTKRKTGTGKAEAGQETSGSADPVATAWPMVQTGLQLPQDLYDRLRQAGGDRGLGGEIRRRLQSSFNSEAVDDPKTQELTATIAKVAAETAYNFGAWHEDAFAFQVFKAAISTLMMRHQPKGEPVAKPNPDSLADVLFGPNDTAEDVGKMLAALAFRDLQKPRT